MLDSGNKFALCATKEINISTLVLWLSPSTSVSSTNKTDRHYITEILLKVSLNTITLLPTIFVLEVGSLLIMTWESGGMFVFKKIKFIPRNDEYVFFSIV
jgi:hypothetical protein